MKHFCDTPVSVPVANPGVEDFQHITRVRSILKTGLKKLVKRSRLLRDSGSRTLMVTSSAQQWMCMTAL